MRIFVPAREFWAVPDLYRAVDTPGVRYTYKPTMRGSAFGVAIRTNTLGFRGPDWTMPKPPGLVRIALIGDSHAFGLGVPFDDTAGEVLSRMLRRCGTPNEVLNFGVNAYNSEQELGVLRAYALGFEPDLFVILPTSNDHESAPYADDSGFLIGVPAQGSDSHSLRASIWRAFGPGLERSHLYLWLRRRYLGWSVWTAPSPTEELLPDPGWMAPLDEEAAPPDLEEAVGRPLRAMIAEARSRTIPVVLASLAGPIEYRRLLRRITSEESVPWVELLALLPEAHSWPDVLRQFGLGWDPHLNAVAHERWGRALFRMIDEHGYVGATAAVEPSECMKLRAAAP